MSHSCSGSEATYLPRVSVRGVRGLWDRRRGWRAFSFRWPPCFISCLGTSLGRATGVVVLAVRHGSSSGVVSFVQLVQRRAVCKVCARTDASAGASSFLIRTRRGGTSTVDSGGSLFFAPSLSVECFPHVSKLERGVQYCSRSELDATMAKGELSGLLTPCSNDGSIEICACSPASALCWSSKQVCHQFCVSLCSCTGTTVALTELNGNPTVV